MLILSLMVTQVSAKEVYVAPPMEELAPQPQTVEELVTFYAYKYGVSQDLAHYIAKNESHYREDAVGDLFPCRNEKSPHYLEDVYARGVYQITRCYHYNVSDEDAFDAESNIEYAMKLIAKGRETCEKQFSTCRNYYK